jgi:hypothetical protein
MRSSLSLLVAVASIAGLAARPLAAQQAGATPGAPVQAPAPVTHTQAVTVQPISIIVGVYSAEFERAISAATTLGLGATYWNGFVGEDDPYDPSYLSVDAKLRYYPGEQPLRGFSFGVTGGYSSVTSRDCSYDVTVGCVTNENRSGGPTLGFQLDYNWLLGRQQNFVVALGVGGKRLFVNDRDGNITVAYPTARVSVGLAF